MGISTRSFPLPSSLIAGVIASLALSSVPASAVTVVVGNVPYELEVFQGSYLGNEELFASIMPGNMPWWGDEIKAMDFATQVFDQLQEGSTPGSSPLFAYEVIGSDVNGWSTDITNPNSLYLESFNTVSDVKYAVGRAVPGPLPLFGIYAGFSFSRRIRQRLKSKASAV